LFDCLVVCALLLSLSLFFLKRATRR
jgi:hypothetical protein